ncbi:hypothetical protein GJA_1150 [Janthinobacterium agaricidamnosum NBRC 102515 = DSM 9628]|uniref:Uncharacterized protein n=1 Tax=Janthinobacterium agaricidamnosum NBRC 102515 = DSM 9628 TaxID=1349767 RepID=W0UZ13_9BURK|nr:hypothetical protein GJA_1150 [Janthinobacterium agaricidamnosum NBRC 102515 = DSM 9628]
MATQGHLRRFSCSGGNARARAAPIRAGFSVSPDLSIHVEYSSCARRQH